MSVLPSRDREYLTEHKVAFEEVAAPQKAVILRGYAVPQGRFDHRQSDMLILLPDGYPLVPPDMFFALPWLRLPNGRYPNCADQPFQFANGNWQRWSRHNPQWRPGIDGIWTMLRRIDVALEKAA